MSRKSSTPVLPGQSRSAACSKTCHRLAGHKGEHRGTLTATTKSSVRPEVLRDIEDVEAKVAESLARREAELRRELKAIEALRAKVAADPEGVEVLSWDRYEVQPEPKARRTRRPAKQLRCRVAKAGRRCVRAYGHKQAGIRHSFAVVTTLPEAGPKGRDVQTLRHARRGGSAHVSGRPSARLA